MVINYAQIVINRWIPQKATDPEKELQLPGTMSIRNNLVLESAQRTSCTSYFTLQPSVKYRREGLCDFNDK